jgi:hypothetical protein
VKDQAYSKRVNVLDELKSRVTAVMANVNKGHVTARLSSGVDCRWDVCRAADGPPCEVFLT